MKVLFITDLHGCQWKYDQLLKLARDLQVNVVINGGDMLPNSEDLFSQGEFIISYLNDHLAHFDSAGIYYLCYLGNDDLRIFDELLEKTCSKYTHAVYLAQRKYGIGDLEFVGFNWVVDYPFRLKDRCRMDTKGYIFQEQLGTGLLSTLDGWKEVKDWFSYARTLPTIEDEINQLVHPKNVAQSIYVIHMPPYKLGLDESGNGQKVGSKAIYDFLLKYQPKLSLHGHIHESPEVSGRWYAKLGNAICIQPGQLDALTYVVVDLDTMEFERYTEFF